MSGMIYLAGALILGAWFLYSGIQVLHTRTRLQAHKARLTSVIYLPLLYALMVLAPCGI